MIILGLDPGYAIVGFGVVKYMGNKFTVLDFGAITTNKDEEFTSRLGQVYDGVSFLLDKWKPASMAVEQLFYGTNSTTAIGVAQARGCVLLAAKKHNVAIGEYTPLQVKQAVTGYGKAEKSQVMEMTKLLLHLDHIPKPDDAADALAVAICHAHTGGSLMANMKGLR
ncbi:MAG: crossover junction endodeoxyribonuclease RuvC [Clostridiales bacterium 43-6]|nr:MAG: crossover junction endodeoxyribonuclease RuvC [Clostridiales bacterium 43-6]